MFCKLAYKEINANFIIQKFLDIDKIYNKAWNIEYI